MNYRLQFRRYALPFRGPVRTAHGVWSEREGLIVRVEDEAGRSGLGEAAPIPQFGTETVDDDEAGCRELGEWTNDGDLAGLPHHLGCLRHAVATALLEIERTPPLVSARPYAGVAALLPAGRAALAAIGPRLEAGFRVFKWKVGVGDLGDELAMMDDLCAALPTGAKLRLDANGAWDRRRAEACLERCAECPVEFLEQPCFAPAAEGATRQRKMDDVLLGLAGDYPTPIALDESLVGEDDIERWIGAGWPGVFVVKPSLLGDVAGALARLEKARAAVVFSSALETAVGARAALRVALSWGGESEGTAGSPPARALGFGVWPLFADARFDGPHAAPFIRAEDVERLDTEAVWNALS